jgi:dinuclear metal center YbgI/SA1388 family protein
MIEMKIKLREIVQYLEKIAPPSYQENYDNSGLLVGNPAMAVTGILCTLDCVESIIDEAIAKNCNVVVAHHPIIFGGLKRLTGKNYVERTVMKAIKHDIAIYAIHTNLDHVLNGVNAKIAEKIGLHNLRILAPKKQLLKKLTTFVPTAHTEKLLAALSAAGAGNIGNYTNCSFTVQGEGTFQPNDKAQPHIGQANVLEKVQETRIEVIFPSYLEGQVLGALRKNHPYEEVACYVHLLENENQEVGAGLFGELAACVYPQEFLQHLQQAMQLKVLKHTQLFDKPIKRVAVCGGSGSFLLKNALAVQADVFITADYKYHEFFDAEDKITIIDIGHYESEVFTKDLLADFLQANFKELPIQIATTNTNPVNYFF